MCQDTDTLMCPRSYCLISVCRLYLCICIFAMLALNQIARESVLKKKKEKRQLQRVCWNVALATPKVYTNVWGATCITVRPKGSTSFSTFISSWRQLHSLRSAFCTKTVIIIWLACIALLKTLRLPLSYQECHATPKPCTPFPTIKYWARGIKARKGTQYTQYCCGTKRCPKRCKCFWECWGWRMNLLRNLVRCSDTKRLLVYLFLYSKLLNLSSAREEAVPLVILGDKKF